MLVHDSTMTESISGIQAATNRSKMRSVGIVSMCTLAMVVSSGNITAASIALPTIRQDLDIPQDKLQWINSAYPLTFACFLLPFGRLADVFGRKKLFILGASFSSVFALGCGFAQSAPTLDILRAFQGMGMATIGPASIGILAQAFPPSRARSIAFLTFSAGNPIGGGLGFSIGGILTQKTALSWRATFFYSAAMGLLTVIGALVFFENDQLLPKENASRSPLIHQTDWLGALLVAAGLILLIFGLTNGRSTTQGWRSPSVVVSLVIGVFLIIAFVFWQRYLEIFNTSNQELTSRHPSRWTPYPMAPLSLWARGNGRMAAMFCIALFHWSAFSSWQFWTQLYYQDYVGLSPVQTMLRLLPMNVTGLLCNIGLSYLVGRIAVMWLLASGTFLTAIACLLLAIIDPHTSYWTYGFFAAILSVFGTNFVFSSGTLFIANVAQEGEQSVAGSLFQTMVQLGTFIGLAITTIVANAVTMSHPAESTKDAALAGYRAAQWACFGFGMLGICLFRLFLIEPCLADSDGDVDYIDQGSRNNRTSKTEGCSAGGGGRFQAGIYREGIAMSLSSNILDAHVI